MIFENLHFKNSPPHANVISPLNEKEVRNDANRAEEYKNIFQQSLIVKYQSGPLLQARSRLRNSRSKLIADYNNRSHNSEKYDFSTTKNQQEIFASIHEPLFSDVTTLHLSKKTVILRQRIDAAYSCGIFFAIPIDMVILTNH